MALYNVEVIKKLSRVVEQEADSYEDAEELVATKYAEEEIVLDWEDLEYTKYEQIAIIAVANIGLITNRFKPSFILIVFFNAIIEIPNATKWHATDAIAAPLTPIEGIGTKIKFRINFTITPTS